MSQGIVLMVGRVLHPEETSRAVQAVLAQVPRLFIEQQQAII